MSEREVVKHYYDKLRTKEITLADYDKGVSYWRRITGRDNLGQVQVNNIVSDIGEAKGLGETLCEQFGGHIIEEPEAKSQKARLLELLMDGKKHTTNEIKEKVYKVTDKSCYANIHGRASELRKEGWDIPDADSKEAKNEKGEICYWIKNVNRLL
jgi:hypothetical protein